MKNTKSIIYLIESILDISISLALIIYCAIGLARDSGEVGLNISILVTATIFLGLTIAYIIILTKKKIVSSLFANIMSLTMCVMTMVCFLLMIFKFKLILFIIFICEFILTMVAHFLSIRNKENSKYPHLKRSRRKSPTCTIQISTEYLVKDSYTPEEAERTINQLYSLHENEGFSMKDYETIKEKIIRNIKTND